MLLSTACLPNVQARGQIVKNAFPSRSGVCFRRRPSHLRPLAATTADDRGLSGFDVDGMFNSGGTHRWSHHLLPQPYPQHPPPPGNRPTSPKAWEIMIDTMRRNKVAMITATDLEAAQEAGIPIIDVRPVDQYQSGFIQDSINVPLYQPIEGWDQRQILRRLGFALFGVFNGTEINPNFLEEMAQAAPDTDKGVVLICNLGGSMAPVGEHKKGQQSRYGVLGVGGVC